MSPGTSFLLSLKYNKGMNKTKHIKLLTIGTDNVKLIHWEEHAQRYKWDYEIVTPTQNIMKPLAGAGPFKKILLQRAIAVAQSMSDFDLLCLTDAYDVLINKTPEECKTRYDRVSDKLGSRPLIVGKDAYVRLGPFMLWSALFGNGKHTSANLPDCGNGYINLGVAIGPPKAIILYATIIINELSTEHCSLSACSEQRAFSRIAHTKFSCKDNSIYIDANQLFVQNVSPVDAVTGNDVNAIFIHFPGMDNPFSLNVLKLAYYKWAQGHRSNYLMWTIILVCVFLIIIVCIKMGCAT
jgi:hypothetical protein